MEVVKKHARLKNSIYIDGPVKIKDFTASNFFALASFERVSHEQQQNTWNLKSTTIFTI